MSPACASWYRHTVNLGSATGLAAVFNNGSGTWDNNGGADWHYAVEGGEPTDEWELDGALDADSPNAVDADAACMAVSCCMRFTFCCSMIMLCVCFSLVMWMRRLRATFVS